MCPLIPSRRVHISSVTLEHLKGSYKVEPGDGQSRDSYLKEHGVVTYLVINPKVRIQHCIIISLYTVYLCLINDEYSHIIVFRLQQQSYVQDVCTCTEPNAQCSQMNNICKSSVSRSAQRRLCLK